LFDFHKGKQNAEIYSPVRDRLSGPTPPGGLPVRPADIPKGTAMTAFFKPRTKKIDGKKVTENVVIAISFDRWQGRTVAEDKRRVFLCTNGQQLHFRAY
jgi:hypothetical protein